MRPRHLLHLVFLFCIGLHATMAATDNLKWPAGQVPIGQTNGPDTLDDVWQGLFNAWALDPNADADNDGCSNYVETIAGTNPFLPSDCLKVGNTVISGSNVILTVKVEAGKQYRVLSSSGPTGPTWTALSIISVDLTTLNSLTYVPAVDAPSVALKVAKSGTRTFYKLETQDVDSDGDTVSDWAERKLGLSPTSNDTDLDGVLDGAVVTSELATPDVVTITAPAPFATEDTPAAPAQVMISRSRKLLPVTVNYSTTGTAVVNNGVNANPDVNVSPSTTSLVLAAGVTSSMVNVTPIAETPDVVEGGESVTITLTSATNGTLTPPTLGNPNNASVIINPSTVASGTGLTAYYYDTGSSTAADALNFGQPGTYVFTRDASPTTSGTIVVTYAGALSGLAVNTVVKLTFSTGNLNNALYNHANYTVTAVSGQTFTARITAAAALPTSSSGLCGLSIQSFQHPPTLATRVDPTVNFDWQHGTPNGVVISPNNSPENYSATWETYLQPTTAGDYTFQLDADDKARVLIDLDNSGTFDLPGEQILEHGWDTLDGNLTPEVVGTFKQSAAITLAVPATSADRRKMRVEHVETTGDARCRLQWKIAGGSFANIPQANQFTHTQAQGYSYSAGNIVVTPTGGHSLAVGNTVPLSFSSGALFSPGLASTYNGTYTITAVNGTTSFTVPISPTAVTLTGAITTAASNTITVGSTAGLKIGMAITGTGLPANEFITSIGASTITVTTGTGVTAQGSTTLVAVNPSIPVTLAGATTTAGSNTIAVASTAGLAVGMAISGTGLPAGEFITAIGSGNITVTTATGITTQPSTTLTAIFSVTTTATTVANSATITVPSTAGLALGMVVTGVGLPANELITAIGATTITVTTGTGVTTQASTTLTAQFPGLPILVSGAATTAGSTFVSVPNLSGLAVGMVVTGAGLPAGELITSIGNGYITVTTGTGVTTQASTNLTAVLPPTAALTGNGFILNVPTSATTGAYNLCYANTTFSNSPGRVGVDANGNSGTITAQNNGIWLSGTPDVALIQPDTFSIRWAGQVQPQFTEDYTFTVTADDGCTLYINGQPQVMKVGPSASTGTSAYNYDSSTGNVLVNYTGLSVIPSGSFIVGETVRVDPTSGNLSHAPTTAPTYSYDSGTGLAVIDFTNLTNVSPSGFTAGEMIELDPTSGNLSSLSNTTYVITAVSTSTFTVSFGVGAFATGTGNININDTRNAVITKLFATGSTYTYTGATGVMVVNYSNLTGVTPGAFTVGSSVELDPSSGGLSAMFGASYTITAATSTTFTVTFPTGTDTTGSMNIGAPTGGVIPLSMTSAIMFNVGASKYANLSTGNINIDIANKALRDWSSNGNERYVRIPVVGGTRYDIRLDYYENVTASRCILSWYSPSQTKEVIPSNRLYPVSAVPQQPLHISDTYATGLVGGSFSQAIAGSNGATVTLSGAPAWLTYSNGVLSGTPPIGTAGDYQILITMTNAAGTSKSLLNLHIDANAGNVTREVWSPVGGTTVATIPTGTAPTTTTTLTSVATPSGAATNYGERVRGYITAPTTGNYYFWLAANDGAELWISNDAESVNIFKRASTTTGSTTPQTWNAEASQKSGWLALEQGQRYYFEILHKAGATAGADNLALGWSKPGEATAAPSEVVPSYVLSPYVAPAPGSSPGTLYIATMLAQGTAVTSGVGSSTLRISEDGNYGYLTRSYSNLTGPITSEHIHADPYLAFPSTIIFDIDAPVTPGDGMITNPADPRYTGTNPQTATYKWTILPVSPLSKADIQELIKQGKAYINLHTAAFGTGEIRGNFTFANGSRTFTAPPAPSAWTDDSGTDAGAARFLMQASFGANTADIAALKALPQTGAVPASGIPASRYDKWIDDQFLLGPTPHLSEVLAREIADVFGPFDVRVAFNTWWKTSMTAPDQLRQRVAFALSEIHVISGSGPLEDNSRGMADFYDTLAFNAFGNFRTILTDTTLTPGMGRYLDMLGNDKQDLAVGRSPNENYAREIKQLFSIGLYRMWPDGTLMLTSTDSPIDTYSQREIVGLAHVFTGWYYGYDGVYRTGFNAPSDWTRPMKEVPLRHDTGSKRVLNNEVLPGLLTLGGQPLDANSTHLFSQYNDPIYQALPGQELTKAHDMLFNHPNVGPFICRQLIQRLVTSNPSRDYLYRVVQKFNDNGSGVRGDMKAVIKAVLLDYEARSTVPTTSPAYGKQREPLLRVAAAARAFRPSNITGTYAQSGANTITVTTSTPHLLQTNNSVFLEFTDATVAGAQPAPTTGAYTVTVTGANTYTIPAPGWMTGTYSQSGTTVTVTMSGHYLPGDNANVTPTAQTLPAANKGQAYFDFTSGGLQGLAGFDNTVQTVVTSTSYDIPSGVGNSATAPAINGNTSGSTFTLTAPDSATRAGNVMISRFGGSYQSTGRNGVITIDTYYAPNGTSFGAGTYGTMADHGLSVGDTVFLNFTNSRDTTSFVETSTENDLAYTIATVPDANTFTVAARDAANAAMNSDNQVVVFPLEALPLTRNGNITTRPSTYNLDRTDDDLGQTPINSPTVFNYFLPDFKFPGSLAAQGITTPEFQGTSETTVIRHENFIYNGLFNPSNTTGISSFKTGTNALVLDLGPWMGIANAAGPVGSALGAGPQPTQVWTSNANVSTLIDRLNTLLVAGQLPAAAKTAILGFIGGQPTSISAASPAVFTMPVAHGLAIGDTVIVNGVTGGTYSGGSTSVNGTFLVNTVPSTTTYTLKSTSPNNQNCTVAPTSLVGAKLGTINISAISVASPCVITTATAHGLTAGSTVTVTGVTGGTFTGASTTINTTFIVNTAPTSTTVTLAATALNCSVVPTSLTTANAGIVSYSNATPTTVSTSNSRDRLRAILHFILTSPDYTIQR